MRFPHFLTVSAVAIGCTVIAHRVQAADYKIIATHSGQSNPTTEAFGVTGNTSMGSPVVSGGVSAWKIADANAGAELHYTHGLSMNALQTTAMLAQGWHLKWIIEIVSGAVGTRAIEINVKIDNDAGGPASLRRYNIQMYTSGTDAKASLLVGTTPTVTIPGGAVGFHTWELIKAPGTGHDAQLFVDGTFVANYSGWFDPSGSPLYFGSVVASSLGEANWAFVQFSLPEPATTALTGLGSLVLLRRRR